MMTKINVKSTGKEKNEKLRRSINSFVIGDALGVPYEFRARDKFKCEDLVGHGTYDQPVGSWSDDSSLMLILLEELIDYDVRFGIDYDNLMSKFQKYVDEGYMTPLDYMFDIGGATIQAINKSRSFGVNPLECGVVSESGNGNGGLMRVLPLAYLGIEDKQRLFNLVEDVCSLTHRHKRSIVGSYLYVSIAKELYETNNSLETILNNINNYTDILEEDYKEELKHYDLDYKTILNKDREDVESGGYVVSTFNASLWVAIQSQSIEEGLLLAVNLGEDTDTTACVSGGLLGLMHETTSQLLKWKRQIIKINKIEELTHLFTKSLLINRELQDKQNKKDRLDY